MAKKITELFICKGIISENDVELYTYCFELLLSTIINFFLLLIVSLITNRVAETVCYLAGFLPIRMTAGGFHAGSHIKCLLTLAGFYTVFLMFTALGSAYFMWFILFGPIVLLVIVIAISPIPHENKPISMKLYRKYKILSYGIAAVMVIMVAFIIKFDVHNLNNRFLFSFAMGMVTIAISLILAYIQNKVKGRRKSFEYRQETRKHDGGDGFGNWDGVNM